jgi:hypothetical protein
MASVEQLMTVRSVRPCTPELVDQLWQLYLDSYAEVAEKVATRELLYRTEFETLLMSPRTTTWMCYQGDSLIAMCPLAEDLSVVPWVNAQVLANRYPGRLIRYLALLVVAPSARQTRAVKAMSDFGMPAAREDGAVMVFDTSSNNNGAALSMMMGRLIESYGVTSDVEAIGSREVRLLRFDPPTGSAQ